MLGVFWLASVAGQALSYRRSSGERRLQLKLAGGSVIAVAGGALGVPLSGSPSKILHIVGSLGIVAVLALPVRTGVAILTHASLPHSEVRPAAVAVEAMAFSRACLARPAASPETHMISAGIRIVGNTSGTSSSWSQSHKVLPA